LIKVLIINNTDKERWNSMLESIYNRRIKHDAGYDLYLEVPESEYLLLYEDVSNEGGKEILQKFLQLQQDDGRPQNIEINHDKKNHIINIKALLQYEGNNHTEAENLPNYLGD